VFDYKPNTAEEQVFLLLPGLAIGTHLKITLIGKPTPQYTDDKFYLALRYVGVQGVALHSIENKAAAAFLE